MKRILAILLLSAATVHATLTVTDRGTGTSNASTSSLVCQPNATIAAGSTAVLNYAGDNANGATTNLPSTITDSVGNKWYLERNVVSGTANTQPESGLYFAYITTQITSSDNVTITFTVNVTAKCYTFIEIAPTSGKLAIRKPSGTFANSNTTSPSVTTQTLSTGDCIVGMGAAESADTWTGDADTSNGSWSAQQHTAAGTGATGMSITSQQKVVNNTAAQTYNPTLTAADCNVIYCLFGETDLKARTAGGNTNSAATCSVGFAKPLAAGSLAVCSVAVDNAGTNGDTQNLPSSGTDTQSNTWTLRQTGIYDNGAASAGVEIGIYTSTLATAVNPGDNITFTYSIANVASRAFGVWEFTASSYVTGGVGVGATTTTPSVTTGSIANGHTVIGVCASESADFFTADAGTTNGTWSTKIGTSAGSGATGMALITQYKTVTATATQTYAPTLTSADTMIGWIEIAPTTVANQGNFLLFFP